jgi:hypothetical protein
MMASPHPIAEPTAVVATPAAASIARGTSHKSNSPNMSTETATASQTTKPITNVDGIHADEASSFAVPLTWARGSITRSSA